MSLYASEVKVPVTDTKGCGYTIQTKELSKAFLKKTHLEIKELKPKDLHQMIVKNEEFHLIDLRNEKQFERGSIDYKNLVNIDRGYLEFKIEEAVKNKDAKIVLYCCTGKRSAISAKILQDMGYTNVYSLGGGLSDWVDEKLPLMTQYGVMKLVTEDGQVPVPVEQPVKQTPVEVIEPIPTIKDSGPVAPLSLTDQFLILVKPIKDFFL